MEVRLINRSVDKCSLNLDYKASFTVFYLFSYLFIFIFLLLNMLLGGVFNNDHAYLLFKDYNNTSQFTR